MSTGHADDGIDTFVAASEHELRDRQLSILDSDFLSAVEAGALSRAQICEWAKVFYAATRHGRLTIGNFYANAPDDEELRRELAENIYEEETGRISGVGKCHMDVFRSLLGAFGISKNEANAIRPPFGEHLPQGSPIPADEFYLQLSAYGFTVEIPNAEWSARMADALQTNYAFSAEEVRWFTMHAMLDAGHGEEFRKHARKVAQTPGGLDTLRDKTLAMAEAVKQVWNGLGTWQQVAA